MVNNVGIFVLSLNICKFNEIKFKKTKQMNSKFIISQQHKLKSNVSLPVLSRKLLACIFCLAGFLLIDVAVLTVTTSKKLL